VPVTFSAGEHIIAVHVAHFGKFAGKGQLGGPGFFLLCSEDHLLNQSLATGQGWRVAEDPSRQPQPKRGGPKMKGHFAVGAAEIYFADRSLGGWTSLNYDDSAWANADVVSTEPANRWGNRTIDHLLRPDPLPALPDGKSIRPAFRTGEGNFPVSIPPDSEKRIILDCRQLLNAFPCVRVTGGAGAEIELIYCEAPCEKETGSKGNRDEIDGKVFSGPMDLLVPSGEEMVFQPIWFRSFRYILVKVRTTTAALTLESVELTKTGYPLHPSVSVPSVPSGYPWNEVLEITHRTAELCSHETLFDCPHYEQAQFPGDARVMARYHYEVCSDDLLIRKAIDDLHGGRVSIGLLQSHYPSSFFQILPTYSLQWIALLHDFLLQRQDVDFVRPYLPAAREILSWFETRLRSDDLPQRLPFPPFIDWCPQFDAGRAPEDANGGSSIVACLLAQACGWMVALEEQAGYAELAVRWSELQERLNAAVRQRCLVESLGLIADTPEQKNFSVHAQVEACLAGALDEAEAANALNRSWKVEGISQPGTFYYMTFLYDALLKAGLSDRVFELLDPFQSLMLESGLTTWPESLKKQTRSDCHGWSILPALIASDLQK